MIYSRLYNVVENENILYGHKYGFRKHYSIGMVLTYLSNELSKVIDKSYKTIGIFVDLAKVCLHS